MGTSPDEKRAPDAPAAPRERPLWRHRVGRVHLGAAGLVLLVAASTRWCGSGNAIGDANGIARLLGAAAGGTVRDDGFAWEQSRGWLADAVEGRGVVFAAHLQGPSGPQWDVFHANVRVTREGKAIAVRTLANLSDTPLADEASFVASADRVAFASRARRGFTGATAIDLASSCKDCSIGARFAAVLARRGRTGTAQPWDRDRIAFGDPLPNVALQFVGRELELRTDSGVARLDPDSHDLRLSQGTRLDAEAWHEPGTRPSIATGLHWKRDRRRPVDDGRSLDGEPSAASDPLWPPSLDGLRAEAWRTVIDGAAPNAPALVGTRIVTEDAASLEVVAIDTRQLELRAHGGRRRPHALTGPGASGVVPAADRERVVARLEAHPFDGADVGFVEQGRELAPPSSAASIAIDPRGNVWIGRWPERADTLGPMRSLVQTGFPGDGRQHLAAFCTTTSGQVLHAWSDSISPRDLAHTLTRLSCEATVMLEAGASPFSVEESAARRSAPSEESFFTLSRRAPTADASDGATLEPAEGGQPPPSWSPAVLHERHERLDGTIDRYSIDSTRFDWRILPGSADGRGHTCDDRLAEEDERRVLITFGLGSSDPKRVRGLAIGGNAIEPFTSDHGVLLALPFGARTNRSRDLMPTLDRLEVALSVDGLVTEGEAVELVLLAEAGELRSVANDLGAPRIRGAMGMPRPGVLLYAEGRFDHPRPLAEELLARGCRRVVSTDRGRQTHAAFRRNGAPGAPEVDPSEVTLVGLMPRPRGRARSLRP